MTTHKIGDWIAVEQDGQVYTGTIAGIEISRAGTKYTIDLYADNTYRSKVAPQAATSDPYCIRCGIPHPSSKTCRRNQDTGL